MRGEGDGSECRLYRCRSCGAITEWDFELGDEAVCVGCWDEESDRLCRLARSEGRAEVKYARRLIQRRYLARDRGRARRIQRRYFARNRAKMIEAHRLWREKNIERNRGYGREYQRGYRERQELARVAAQGSLL